MLFTGLGASLSPPSGSELQSASDELVWLGIDYSQVRFIGSRDDFSDIPNIRSHYFGSWNELILTESEKYNVAKAFRTATVRNEIDKAVSRSESRDIEGILQTSSYSLEESQVKALVKDYVDPGMEGTGVLIVMETLDKLRQQSTMWVVAFEMSTGEIYYMKWHTGKAGGFGFRNYWARCYYNVLKSLNISLQ
jgi:hypothetical protein